MPERIPQGVAIRVPLQGFLASDHFSPATGLTVAVTISKNGAAYGNPAAGATNATEIANGSYYVSLGAGDTDTVGPLFVRGAVATMDPITVIYNVVAFVEQTGDSFARIGAAGAGLTGITGVTLAATQTGVTIPTVTNLTNAPTNGDLTATMKTSVTTAATAATPNLNAAYDAAKTAAQAGDAMTLTSGERNSAADALLARNVAGGSSAGRVVKEALYVLRNKTDIAAGTLTVYGVDDTTPAFTATVTTAAGNPISAIDPA